MLGWKQALFKPGPISVDNTARDPLSAPLPPIPLDNELQHFRRIQVLEPAEPVRDMDEALSRLAADCTDAAANGFVGLHHLIKWTQEPDHFDIRLSEAERYLKLAVRSSNSTCDLINKQRHADVLILDPFAFEPLYLLAATSGVSLSRGRPRTREMDLLLHEGGKSESSVPRARSSSVEWSRELVT